MAFLKNFITKERPLFTKMGLPQYKKKKKKGTTFMTSISKEEEKTARSLLTTK